MNKKTIRLGAAGALIALSLAGFAVPTHAATEATCGPIVDSVKICTSPDGTRYPVLLNSAASGPRPTVDGALLVGNTLSVFDGAWDPSDARLTHQWVRNDVSILGATGTTYTPIGADIGKYVRVKTTATAPGYATTTMWSLKTAAVTSAAGAVPSVKAPATVGVSRRDSDTDVPNLILDAAPGIWSGAPGIKFRYQWLRDGTAIPGGTAASFNTTGEGKALFSVRITGYASGYDPATLTSAGVAISPWNPTPGAVVTGSTGLGDVLTGVDDVPWIDFNGRGETDYAHFYQWLRDGAAIPGATDLTYMITAEDQGHTLVLFTDTETFDAYSNAVVVPAAAVPSVPEVELKALTNVTKPVLTGTGLAGTPMTVTAGTWSEPADKLTVTYYWQSPDGKVSATGPTFTPNMTQLGANVTLLATATAPGYETAWAKVTAPKPVTAPDPTQTKAPAIRGTATVRQKLTVSAGSWSGYAVGLTETRQWLRDGTPIGGATGRDYTLAGADFGKKISVKVTSTLGGRILKTQTTDATAKVAAAVLVSATPTIAGTTKVGNVVTVKRGTWTWGTTFKYRWLRNGVPISEATNSTYKVRTADRDKRITVRVTGSRLGYTTVSQTSEAYFAR